MLTLIKEFLMEEDGPTAAEYAVMLALMIGAMILGITSAGQKVGQRWQSNTDEIINAIT